MPRGNEKTAACGKREAASRLKEAVTYYEVAEVAAAEDAPETRKVAIANAVLAGIAAADAACCRALGFASRGEDHRAATHLLERITPGGKDAATHLGRLLAVKTDSQYGFGSLAGGKQAAALKHARRLIEFAQQTMAR